MIATECGSHLKRSSHWNHFRDHLIIARGNRCELSGTETDLEGHHIIPFHVGMLIGRGYIELDERNVIILSGGPGLNVHHLIGHFGDWHSFNLDVRNEMDACWAKMDEPGLMNDQRYRMGAMHRPREWKQLSRRDEAALLHYIDEHYPVGKVTYSFPAPITVSPAFT